MKNNTSNHPRYSIVAFASNGKVYGYAELICDEVADLEYLPTENTKIAVGSKCTCLANGKVYTLSNARQWVEDLSNQSDGTDEVYDPPEVIENGDVVVTYNGMKIAATEESGHITLETSGKRVEHDIDIEYTKPNNTVTMPVYGVAQGAGNTPSFLTSYSGEPGVILEVILQDHHIEEIESVIAGNISDPGMNIVIPYYYDFSERKSVFITTLDPATIDPAYNCVIINYSLGD